jgi:carboxylate-amine ligase
MASDPAFSLGIEEEYFLVDAESKQVAFETSDALFTQACRETGGRAGREFLQAQIEAVTTPCTSVQQARAQLLEIRHALADVAAGHGLAILACGTHPSALWRRSVQSQKNRYNRIMGDLQMIGHRNLLCMWNCRTLIAASKSWAGCCPICRCSWPCLPRRRSGNGG